MSALGDGAVLPLDATECAHAVTSIAPLTAKNEMADRVMVESGNARSTRRTQSIDESPSLWVRGWKVQQLQALEHRTPVRGPLRTGARRQLNTLAHGDPLAPDPPAKLRTVVASFRTFAGSVEFCASASTCDAS